MLRTTYFFIDPLHPRNCLAAALKCVDVKLTKGREALLVVCNVANFHVVINSQRNCNNVWAVEFLVNKTGADGIAVQTNNQVEDGGAVSDHDVLIAIKRCQKFLGEIERVVLTLLVRKARVGGKIVECYRGAFCQRVIFSYKDAWLAFKQWRENQALVLQRFSNNTLVE